MAPRTSRHAKLPTKAVKDSDAAANEALLAHAEFTRTAKSWLSAATGGGGGSGDKGFYNDDGDDDEHNQDAASSDKDETTGGRPRKKTKLLDRLKPPGLGGEEMNSDMNGLGYIAPKDASGNPVTAQSVDAGTAFLRKQLLGRNRPRGGFAGRTPPTTTTSRGKKPHGGDTRYPARGAGNGDASDSDEDEDSRSRLGGKVKKPQRQQQQSIRPAGTLEINAGVDGDDPNDPNDDDNGTPTETKKVADQESKGDQEDQSETTQAGPPSSNGPKQKQCGSRPVRMSYLDEMLAERERKKMKKKQKQNK